MGKAAIIVLFTLVVPGLTGYLQLSDKVCSLSDGRVYPVQNDTSRYIFVGAEACAGKCHNNTEMGFQYDIWKGSPHAGSYMSLSTEKAKSYAVSAGISGDPAESSLCLRCHVTASGADPSSLSGTYRKEDGVTCESCHKGEFRPKTYLPGEEECLSCHNNAVHAVRDFDFRQQYGIIRHRRTVEHPE